MRFSYEVVRKWYDYSRSAFLANTYLNRLIFATTALVRREATGLRVGEGI